ncbi:hypothetical protein BDP27DRAFT_1343118 [Rhodocollybia butyracea]|uniref:TEA domain-containing protein n=1 Tax=Rhodocollybia butyracea TaxID=206335 RepID=A0A9P5P4J6_9AGAR|nr:hypothetical protein BDP27DRAFT_1343118 [Rhodocollybia butyracea]
MAYFPSLSNSQHTSDSDASSTSSSSPTLDSRSLSCTTSYNAGTPETDDVFRAVVKCRKSWKTLKGGKVVWPLHLEAALLEGLSLYQPDNSRETLLLGRFPMRNRFISEHILRTTGEVRTAKQVGSRLQQLRDTCGGGRKLQKLLSPVLNSGTPVSNRSHYSLRRYGSRSSMHSSSSGPGSPVSTDEVDSPWNLASSSSNVFYIDILPESTSTSIVSDLDYTEPLEGGILSKAHGPRPIRAIKPCLAFTSNSDSSLNAISEFTVSNGEVEYRDQSPLSVDPTTPTPEGSVALYTCHLVPNFWEMICHSPDPTQFTIYHTVERGHSLDSEIPLFSATYKFRYMPPQRLRSPPSSFAALTSGINTSQDVHAVGREWFQIGNIQELPTNDYKNWQDCVPMNQHRGYDSMPASPGWDDYRTLDSNSSSPTTPNFPSQSQLYLSH